MLPEPQIIDIQIIELAPDRRCIILVFRNSVDSETFYNMMIDFKVKIYTGKLHTLILGIEIINADKLIKIDTKKTIINYPPVKWMFQGAVNLITTGHNLEGQKLIFLYPKPLRGSLSPGQLN